MKEEEKQRKFHGALLKMLYPSPPSPPPHQEEEGNLIDPLDDLPGNAEGELENEEGYSLPSSSDDSEGENGGTEKLTRAQRKRLRKKKLKETASRSRKIVGPLLPGSNDDSNDGSVAVVGNMPESVRQNAAAGLNSATDISGESASCSKQNKLKQRRKSKKLAGKNLNSSSIESSTSNQIQDPTGTNDGRTDP